MMRRFMPSLGAAQATPFRNQGFKPQLIVFFLFAALLLAGCGEKKQTVSAAPPILRDVALVEVQRATVPDYVEAMGTVHAAQTSQLSSQIVATITAIRAIEGQHVRKGDVLVVLDDAQQQAAVERATAGVNAARQDIAASDADYNLANSTLTRYQTLFERKSVSPHEFDQVQAHAKAAAAHRDQAQAGLMQATAAEAQARSALGYTRIRAPFDGVITEKRVDPGALATPGVPLLTIEDTRRFRMEVTVDEHDIGVIHLGPATIVVDALGEFPGKIVQIVPAADPASRSFLVKVELPADARLRSGLSGHVRFNRGERQAITIPRTAVLDRGQLQAVYVVGSDKLANLRYVTLGKPVGQQVEVLAGLQQGESLVAQPGDRELAGRKIEAAR
jgi:RND family efflux transporter MFP subunit